MDTSKGRREGDSKRLRETTETIEIMETKRDALQGKNVSKRQLETDRDQGDWRDFGDQWICTQA